jgi:hypothetical protein
MIAMLFLLFLLEAQTFTQITTNFNSIDVGYFSQAATCDIDADGNIDILIGSAGSNIYHYKQDAENSTIFNLISTSFQGITTDGESAPTFTDLDGDGLIDLLIGNTMGNILHYEQDSANSYSFTVQTPYFNSIDVEQAPKCRFIDLDGDGLLDLLIGESRGNIWHYKQNSLYSEDFTLVTEYFNSIDVGVYSSIEISDLDGDNLIDILIGNESGTIWRYEQDGVNSLNFTLITNNFMGIDIGTYSDPLLFKMDTDSNLDLLIGKEDGTFSYWESDTSSINSLCITTTSAANITSSSAQLGGEISDDNFHPILQRGICLSNTNNDPDLNDTIHFKDSGSGTFSEEITDLITGDTYFYRTFCISTLGDFYGEVQSFTTTTGPPAVTTVNISNITNTTAESGGEISNDGGSAVIQKGVCWSINPDPTTSDFLTDNGSGTDSFISTISSLTTSTQYFVRAYAINSYGTGYGNVIVFIAGENLPVLTTKPIDTSGNEISSGGNISDDGGIPITGRGICWSTSVYPTLSNFFTSDGTGTGEYTSTFINLDEETEYFVRAYATNGNGTNYGNQISFTTLNFPTITTTEPNIMVQGIQTGGIVTQSGGLYVHTRGVCYSKIENPTLSDSITVNGTGLGEFVTHLWGILESSTTYYIKAYATNALGTSYGEQKIGITMAAPVVSTDTEITIKNRFAISGGEVLDEGDNEVQVMGLCWSTNPNPTTSDSRTIIDGELGHFISTMTNLIPEETYYYRAYADNAVDVGYGEEYSFTTFPEPVLTTDGITQITGTSAVCGGNVTSEAGEQVTAKGVCWKTSHNPTISNSKTVDGSGLGSFVSAMSGLSDGTRYYVRAYATNLNGTAYGEERSFITYQRPMVTTMDVTSKTMELAFLQGEVTDEGEEMVTQRGFCWSTSPNPTLDDSQQSSGSGLGEYETFIGNLLPESHYYVRAYAINPTGTGYGNQVDFYTNDHSSDMIDLNGTSEYLETEIELPENGTFECWINLDDISDSQRIFDAEGNESTWNLTYSSNSGYYVNLGAGSSIGYNYSSTNTWHHIAVTWAKRTEGSISYIDFQLYVNGVLLGQLNGNIWEEPDSTLRIGSNPTESVLLNGKLDELRIWNVIKNSTDIQNNLHNPVNSDAPGLLCYYDFDDTGSGNIVFNKASNCFHSKLKNSTETIWLPYSTPLGEEGQLLFNQTASSIGNTGFQITTTITSNPNNVNYLGSYTSGDGAGIIDFEIFPFGVTHRSDIVWGVYEYGNVTANCTFEYSGLNELNTEKIGLLMRQSPVSEWEDITPNATHDRQNFTFTLSGLDDSAEFSIGFYEELICDQVCGNALDFDGIDDNITIPHTEIGNPEGSFSIEAWVKLDNILPNNSSVISKHAFVSGSSRSGYVIEYNSDSGIRANLGTQTGWVIIQGGIWNVNEWHYVALTFDETTHELKFYDNGYLLGTELAENVIYNTNDLQFGASDYYGNYLCGAVDEVSIWNSVRSAVQIRENMHIPLDYYGNGLISYWQFNDGIGTNLTDEIVGNNGILNNMSDENWIPSTIPFGSGFSDSQTEIPGMLTFENTGLSMFFNSSDNADITVSRINTNPSINPVEPELILDDQYWVVERYGSGSFNADLTFTPNENITLSDVTNPASIKLYIRAGTADTAWSFLQSAASVDAESNTITFTGITDLSQFILGKSTSPDIFVESDSLNIGNTFIGGTIQDTLTIYNLGDDTMFITDILFSGTAFSNNVSTCEILPSASSDVIISFSPIEYGIYSEVLTIFSNDPDEEEYEINYSGNGTRPIISVVKNYDYELVTSNFNSIDVNGASATVFEDMDHDGLLDMLVGQRYGKIYHYEQNEKLSTSYSLITDNFNSIDVGWYSKPVLTDFENDGLWDLIIGEGDGKLIYYKQDSEHSYSFSLITNQFNSIDLGDSANPAFTDLEGDGLLDMIIGQWEGTIYRYEQSSNNSTSFSLISSSFVPNSYNASTPAFSDFDHDGLLDLIIGESNGTLRYYKQNAIHSTSFSFVTDHFNNIDVGGYSAPAFSDIDNDGLMDLFVGRDDGTMNHYTNATIESLLFDDILIDETVTMSCYLEANELLADLEIQCNNGFTISLSEDSAFSQTLIIPFEDGSISKKLFIRYTPSTLGIFEGEMTLTSFGADPKYISLSGNAKNIDNFPGNALEFDGIDKYVDCSTDNQLTGSNTRTIEAWAYTESFNNGGIFQAGNTGTVGADFSLRTLTTENSWRAQFWGSADIDVILPNSINEWHHYCLTYDGTTVKLYYDGDLVVSQDASLNTASHDVYFGRWADNYFDGKIDEIRIWNVAQDSIQIRENMYLSLTGTEPGLIGYWQCNKGTGNVVSDVIGGNTGSLINMNDENWVASTIPFGSGVSNSQAESTGTVDFTDTGISMDFTSQNGAEITVTRIDTTANINPIDPYEVFATQYWIVNRFGTGTFDTDMTFTLDGLTMVEENNPSQIVLFTRGSNSDDAWVYLTSADFVNSTTGDVTFNGITNFSQFIIARWIQEIDSPQNVTIQQIGTDIQISWDEVSGANSYKIFAADSPDGTYTDITSSGTFVRAKPSQWSEPLQMVGKKQVRNTSTQKIAELSESGNRSTQTWIAPVDASKKFYYIKASSESRNKPEKVQAKLQ